jgi:hypothetical protein
MSGLRLFPFIALVRCLVGEELVGGGGNKGAKPLVGLDVSSKSLD